MTGQELLSNLISDELFAKLSDREKNKINKLVITYDKEVEAGNESEISDVEEDLTDLVARYLSEMEIAEQAAIEKANNEAAELAATEKENAENEKKRKGGFFSWFQKD